MTTRKAAAATPQGSWPHQPDAPPLSPAVKVLLSGLLIFHLTAVFWAPFAFACNVDGSTSPLANPVGRWLHPYIAALYLDHGYFFFAPNPGPSHLVRYKVEFDDGREPLVGTFPDLVTERPRLLYHRHFMLSESLYNRFAPPSPPLVLPAGQIASIGIAHPLKAGFLGRTGRDWRRQYEALWQAFEEHLRHEHGGSQVTLTRVEHPPPAPDEVRIEKRSLRAAESYIDLPETVPPEGRP